MMTPADRRRLIEAPIVITHSGGRGWAGVTFNDLIPHGSRRRSVYYDSDERSSTLNEGADDANPKSKR